MYSPRLGRSLVAALVAAVGSLALTATVGAEPVKCKAAIVKASASYAQSRAKLLQKCEDTIVKGKLPQSTVCTAEAKTTEKLAKAVTKLASSIGKACGGADKLCGGDITGEDGGTAIGFPATCPNFESGSCTNAIGTTDCTGIATCILCIDNAAVDQAIGLSYASLVTTDPKAEKALNKCQAAIGKSAAGFLAAKSKALSKCWDAVNKGKGNAPCPVPGDGKAAAAIAKAFTKLADGIKKACAGKDKILGGVDENADFTPTQIGFPATCNDVDPPGTEGPCGGPVNDLQGVITCLGCVNEFKVDCADGIAAAPLSTYPFQCNPGPTPTPTLTPTPTPTVTATTTPVPVVCGDGIAAPSEPCDASAPAATWAQCGPDFTCTGCNCACPSKVHFRGDPTAPVSVLDAGWTGFGHRAPIISNGDVTVGLSCGATERPCGTCTIAGPIPNLEAGAGQLDNQRCSHDSSIRCTDDTPCIGGGGTCEFYFGSLLPLAAGGVSTCVSNMFNGPVTGTANIETGEATTIANLTSRVSLGIVLDSPCAQCVGDATLNDGVLGGTCDGGTRDGLACDGNGSVTDRPDFGTTSLDCPSNPGALVAVLPIDLSNATDPVTKTLTAAGPNCLGDAGAECLCETCNSPAAETCDSNADCPDPAGPIGPICGGKRCIAGVNAGQACTNNTECPASQCARKGEPTKVSACLDDIDTVGVLDCVDTAPVDGEGECTAGPVTSNCTVASGHAQRGCGTDADCGGAVGSCASANRKCFLTGGLTALTGTDTLVAEGMEDAPVGDVSNPTLGAVFCIGATSADSVNTAAGLPGPGRVTILGQAEGLP
jgi:hypothetical protein